jgi:hypothetical protein
MHAADLDSWSDRLGRELLDAMLVEGIDLNEERSREHQSRGRSIEGKVER